VRGLARFGCTLGLPATTVRPPVIPPPFPPRHNFFPPLQRTPQCPTASLFFLLLQCYHEQNLLSNPDVLENLRRNGVPDSATLNCSKPTTLAVPGVAILLPHSHLAIPQQNQPPLAVTFGAPYSYSYSENQETLSLPVASSGEYFLPHFQHRIKSTFPSVFFPYSTPLFHFTLCLPCLSPFTSGPAPPSLREQSNSLSQFEFSSQPFFSPFLPSPAPPSTFPLLPEATPPNLTTSLPSNRANSTPPSPSFRTLS